MPSFCHYHPTRTAHWICPRCHTNLCPGCVVERDKGGYGLKLGKIHLCPKCYIQAEWVGAANLIEPFWQRLPSFFAYPFKQQPLVLNIILTVVTVLLGWVPFAKLVLYAVLIKYAYKILLNTIYGDLRPPAYSSLADFNDITPVVQQWALFFVLWFLGGAILTSVGVFGAVVYMVAVIFLLPAMIILLATSERLGHALNPVVTIGMVVRIGWGYLLMWFFLSLLLAAPSSLIYLTAKFIPAYLLAFIVCFARNYYTFVAYYLMGYVILQYHEQLNYSIDYDQFFDPSAPATDAAASQDPQQHIIDQVEILTKEGRAEDAIAHVRDAVGTAGITSLVLMERFYGLLKLKKEIPDMLEQGRDLLHRLIKEDQQEKACSVYIECASVDKEFRLPPQELIKLAGWLQKDGKYKGAVNALTKIVKFSPEDVLAPKAYFQLAQIHNEKLDDALKAKRMIDALIKRYPDHDIIPFARRYISNVQA
jgi:tetratricopeptide (TPR) repeat protein